MKRRTVLKVAALVPAIALPLAVPLVVPRKRAHLHIDAGETSFYDDDGIELARVQRDGRVVREPGTGVIIRCGRIFWEAMAADGDGRLIGSNWPLSVSIYNGFDPPWSVDMPANGSIREMKFENVDSSARFFWIMIQAARPAALTWS